MKICVAGEGAFGNKHLDAIARITDIEVVALAGGVAEDTASLARNRGIPFWTLDLEEAMAQPRCGSCHPCHTNTYACTAGGASFACGKTCIGGNTYGG